MKRLLAIAALAALPLAAQEIVQFISTDFKPSTVSACDVQVDAVAPEALSRNFLDDTNYYVASQFTASSNYTTCKVQFSLKKVGSPTMNLSARIWSGTSTAPTNLIATGSTTVAASSLTTSYATNDFSVSATISGGTNFWVGLYGSALGDASNYVQLERNGSGSGYIKASVDGITWIDFSSTRKIGFSTWR